MRTAKLTVLIPAAGCGHRMRSYGPKALIKIGGEHLINRQIRLLKSAYPDAKFVVVGGYQVERVEKKVFRGVLVVKNEEYETTNVASSIAIGMKSCDPNSAVLVVYGDLVFPHGLFVLDNDTQGSRAWVGYREDRKKEVGVAIDECGLISNFSFGLPKKWCHAVYLEPTERRLFEHFAAETNAKNKLGYEILNSVISHGGKIAAVNWDGPLVEIDFSSDILHAEKLFGEI